MRDPSAEMQKAIFAKLTGSSALTTRLGAGNRIVDKAPATQVYPYIRVGDDSVADLSNSCADGWDVTCTLHIFSRHAERPRMEAKEISDLALQAIGVFATPPTPTGFVVKDLELVQARTFMEADGLTAHAVLAVSYLVRQAAA